MFTKSAEFYDALYSWKDYESEVATIRSLIERHRPGVGTVLDVACGTGKHVELLRDHYELEGLDLDDKLLEIAQTRNPGVRFHQGDMVDFDLGRSFDVVLCLFSSIGYVETAERLASACAALARHVSPGGLLLLEPWLTPETFEERHVGMLVVDEPELKITRLNATRREGDVSIIPFHYLVGRPDGVEHFTEEHRMGLFTDVEYATALEAPGLEIIERSDLMGRGLYVAARPAP